MYVDVCGCVSVFMLADLEQDIDAVLYPLGTLGRMLRPVTCNFNTQLQV